VSEGLQRHQPGPFPGAGSSSVESSWLAKLKAILRRPLDPFVPSHYRDLPALARRLFRSREPGALYAMRLAAFGTMLTPLDLLLQLSERQLYAQATEPKLPVIFVCGAPRSGTTLVAQFLIKNLPVSYLNNAMAVFPRSPITANALLGPMIAGREIEYDSFYGRTLHFSGPNDALQQWDRWFGNDRKRIPTGLTDQQREAMIAFFGALEKAFGKPLVAKNNSLNTCAHLVAAALKTAHFICVTREPLYLAQSLLRARFELYGDPRIWYGVEDSAKSCERPRDIAQDVCDQVRFHERSINEQRDRIGPARFWVISYEEFCADPSKIVRRVSETLLRCTVSTDRLAALSKPFITSNRVRIEPALFDRMERILMSTGTEGLSANGASSDCAR